MASPPDGISTGSTEKASVSEAEALNQLRNILLAPEHTQLEQLQNRIENPSFQVQDVSRVLPDAILLRSRQDAQLTKALSPILSEVLTLSIKKSPRVIVDAISPIMAPAIRHAIFSALQSMVQSLNQTLEHSVSWKGLQWRIESFRTGKPFAEIVLLHTLRFRVEQVFLIHRETGLLLQHVAADVGAIQDEEVVSGMLTAIQDFVRDSFGGAQSDSLESLRVGELTVWIEQGSKALLAGVVRGTPPLELRQAFQQVLETVHVQFGDVLETYSGEQGVFEKTRTHLEDCLQAQFKGGNSKPSPVLWVMVILLCAGLGIWGVWNYLDYQRWTTFLQQVEKEPGVIVTGVTSQNGTRIVNGLRDPLSVEPTVLAEQAGLNPESIQFQFEPYFAVSPHFLEMRVRSQMRPPDSVDITVDNTSLIVKGQASHQWISRLQSLPLTIPGLTKVVTEHLTDTDMKRFEALRQELERHQFLFARGSARLPETEGESLLTLSKDIQEIDALAALFDQKVRIEIQGQTSQGGSALRNKQLRLARAKAVWKILPIEGLRNTYVVPVELDRESSHEAVTDPALARRVSLKVFTENQSGVEKGFPK